MNLGTKRVFCVYSVFALFVVPTYIMICYKGDGVQDDVWCEGAGAPGGAGHGLPLLPHRHPQPSLSPV